MMRYTEDMKIWLFDLAHGNLSDQTILSGFIKHYVLFDLTVGNVVQDIMFHTAYGAEAASCAKQALLRVLYKAAG